MAVLKARVIEIVLIQDNKNRNAPILDFLHMHCKLNAVERVKSEFHALEYLTHREQNTIPKIILLNSTVSKEGRAFFLQKIKSGESTRQIPVIILDPSREFQQVNGDGEMDINTYTIHLSEFSELIKGMKKVMELDACLIA